MAGTPTPQGALLPRKRAMVIDTHASGVPSPGDAASLVCLPEIAEAAALSSSGTAATPTNRLRGAEHGVGGAIAHEPIPGYMSLAREVRQRRPCARRRAARAEGARQGDREAVKEYIACSG